MIATYTNILQAIEDARAAIDASGDSAAAKAKAHKNMDDAEAAVRAACPDCPDPIPPGDIIE